ncbi:helix-turn-helix domain-containing protein [Microbacterium sp. LMI1-1-1.1]|uniref:helix-turn-helix domain-containing protein n=1 Tax=Microbacterium sp. LMI1-1-1.1 TaxID=3135223 RepID=UPI0034659BC3
MDRQFFATRHIPRAERVATWEAHHADSLVGLTCALPRSGTFDAAVRSARFDPYDLAHVVATPHAVERTRRHIRSDEAPGYVLYVSRRGGAELSSRTGEISHGPGSVILCGEDTAFERRFREGVDELVIRLSPEAASDLVPPGSAAVALVSDGTAPAAGMLSASLGRRVQAGLAARPFPQADFTDRLRLLLTPGAATSPDGLRMIVLDHIDAHLHETALSTGVVAERLRVTERTVRRLFAPTGASLAEEIRHRRLVLSRRLLQGSDSVADVARRSGFASHAHFTRAFRAEYGCRPSDVRALPPL